GPRRRGPRPRVGQAEGAARDRGRGAARRARRHRRPSGPGSCGRRDRPGNPRHGPDRGGLLHDEPVCRRAGHDRPGRPRTLRGRRSAPHQPRLPAPVGRARRPVVVSGRGERGAHGSTTRPLPTTVIPPSDTVNPRSVSRSMSTPTVAPSPTVTFLSRIASRTTARRPIRTLCSTTARSTHAQLSTRTPGDSTDSRTSPPDTITPLLTTLLTARPTRPESLSSRTNLAGGCGGTWVRIGQCSLYRLNAGSGAHRSMCAAK